MGAWAASGITMSKRAGAGGSRRERTGAGGSRRERTGADGSRRERTAAARRRLAAPACSRLLPPAPVLGIELSEVLGVHLLEVLLELVGVEPGTRRGLVGLDPRLIEQMVAGEDRRPEPQRERDAVRGARVDLEDLVVAPDEQLGKVGVFLYRADDDPAKLAAQPHDHLLEQVVGERALGFHALQIH